MFFKKRKKKKQTVESFIKTVDIMWNGIHKLDSLIEKIVRKHDVTIDTAIFIQRSVDDFISVCFVYKEHKLFHVYHEPIINKAVPIIQELTGQIVHKAKGLFSLHNLYEMIKEQIEKQRDDDISEYTEHLRGIEIEFKRLFTNVLDDYVTLRESINMIRTVVSGDKMAIICGVDLLLLYEHNEKVVEKGLKRTIRLDKVELDKIKEKVGADHE